jgi:predicted Fe-Mo cluster-binding NifX family protein
MKVAIPLFNSRVSPRFEFASALLLATTQDRQIRERRQIALDGYDLFQRSALLRELGVDLLICGGIQGFIARSLGSGNVAVISPISGEAEEVLQRFLRGNLYPQFCPGRGSRHCYDGNQGRLGCGKNGKRDSLAKK